MADEEHHADQVEDPHEDAERADELKHECTQSNQSAGYSCGDGGVSDCHVVMFFNLTKNWFRAEKESEPDCTASYQRVSTYGTPCNKHASCCCVGRF